MNKLVTSLLVAVWAMLVLLVVLDNKSKRDMLDKVTSGHSKLICDLKGKGQVVIDPDKIVAVDNGYWIFINGQAKSCFVE